MTPVENDRFADLFESAFQEEESMSLCSSIDHLSLASSSIHLLSLGPRLSSGRSNSSRTSSMRLGASQIYPCKRHRAPESIGYCLGTQLGTVHVCAINIGGSNTAVVPASTRASTQTCWHRISQRLQGCLKVLGRDYISASEHTRALLLALAPHRYSPLLQLTVPSCLTA